MHLLEEFKKFIAHGNVVDLAVGVIIGAAFGKIVNSLVNDIVMPPIGRLLHGVDFSSLFFALDGRTYQSLDDAKKAGAATINYGVFINTVIEFLIVAACVFLLVKLVNKIRHHEAQHAAANPPPPTPSEKLLMEIRDELRGRK